jgi:hypothetical protein
MEEMLVYLVGAGVVLLSPIVPGLRPLVKTAIKGGLKAADATRGAAALVGQTWHEVVTQASDEYRAEQRSAQTIRAQTGAVIDADVRIPTPEAMSVEPADLQASAPATA